MGRVTKANNMAGGESNPLRPEGPRESHKGPGGSIYWNGN